MPPMYLWQGISWSMEIGTLLIAPPKPCPAAIWGICQMWQGTWPIFVTQQILFPTLLGVQSHPWIWAHCSLSLAWKCSVPEGRIWLDLSNDICNVPSDRTQRTPTGADKHPACTEVFVDPPWCLSASSRAFGKSALERTWSCCRAEMGVQSVYLGCPDRTLTIRTASLLQKAQVLVCLLYSTVSYTVQFFCLLSSVWKPCFSYNP